MGGGRGLQVTTIADYIRNGVEEQSLTLNETDCLTPPPSPNTESWLCHGVAVSGGKY